MTGAAPERQRAWRWGRWAEARCSAALWLHGYRIEGRRVRTPVGEIDLVARRGRLVAFVEVKARTDVAAAAWSLGDRQRRRIERAAAAFLGRRPDLAGLDIRFDAMLVVPGRWPVWIRDAWRPEAD